MISSSSVSSTVFPKGSVTGCDSSLGSFFYFKVYFSSHSCILFRLQLLRLGSNGCAVSLVVINICTYILKMYGTEYIFVKLIKN